MGFRINTNTAALTAHTSAVMNNRNLDSSLSKLSSGLRINKAADDASGLAIANSLRAQASSLGQAISNGNDAIGLIQTADGALSEYSNILDTIKSKAVQAASDGQNTTSRLAIQKDIDALMKELNIIAKTTSFNGQKLLSGSFQNKEFQMGANANESVKVSIASTETSQIGQTTRSNVTLANSQGGEVNLQIKSALTGNQINLKTINVAFDNTQQNSMGALADEINRYSGETGVSAKAIVSTTGSAAISAGQTGSGFKINGIDIGDINVEANDNSGALVNAINSKTSQTGVTASKTIDGKLTLSSSDGRAIKVEGNITSVVGSSADQMSTIGKLEVVQAGAFAIDMQASGIKALAADVELGSNMTIAQDSVLTSGSVIAAGSKISEGTTVGGAATLMTSMNTTDASNVLIKTGSTIAYGSTLQKGTQVGGSFIVGSTTADAAGTTGRTDLTGDMLVTAGSTLKAGTQLGAGTVVTTDFAGYKAGDVLMNNVQLTSDLVLTSDMMIKDNGGSADSKIAAGSTINTGSVLGANFTVGMIVDSTSFDLDTGGTATTLQDRYVAADTYVDYSAAAESLTITAGSLLKDGSLLTFQSGDTISADLNTTVGVIKKDTLLSANVQYTLLGDQVLDNDLTTNAQAASTSAGTTDLIKAGSILKIGFNTIETGITMLAAVGGAAISSGRALDLATNMTVSTDMSALAGSTLAAGSVLKAGSTFGEDTYVFGTGTNQEITTTQETDLKSGSILNARSAGDSMLKTGSTIGGTLVTSTANEVTTEDMTLKAGSILKNGSILKSGTQLQQDITVSGTEYKAGTVLSANLTLTGADVNITKDMVLKSGSTINAGSTIALNAANSGAINVGQGELTSLNDISVLTLEGAMKAIDTVSAAITNLDTIRSNLGSVQNQVTSTINNISVTQVNVKAAESSIRDVDFAAESANFSKFNILAQSGSYAMSQANAVQQNVLKLLQ